MRFITGFAGFVFKTKNCRTNRRDVAVSRGLAPMIDALEWRTLMAASPSLAADINSTVTNLVAGLTPGIDYVQAGQPDQTQSLSGSSLFTAGSYDTSCIATPGGPYGGATLIAPYFVLEAWHEPQYNPLVGGNIDPYSVRQRVLTASGGGTDIAVCLLSTPSYDVAPAEVLPADYLDYLQPSF